MALVDMSARRTLRNDSVISKAGWTPSDGRAVTGTVGRTIHRGNPVAGGGTPSLAPKG